MINKISFPLDEQEIYEDQYDDLSHCNLGGESITAVCRQMYSSKIKQGISVELTELNKKAIAILSDGKEHKKTELAGQIGLHKKYIDRVLCGIPDRLGCWETLHHTGINYPERIKEVLIDTP